MIDWFTVAAQIINFLILVFLLKKFLYGPIIRAMEEREERIAGRLHEAAEQRAEAEREIGVYRRKNDEFEARRAEMLAQTKETVKEHEKELLEDARRSVEKIRQRWQDAVAQEKETFLRSLRKRVAGEVYAIARKAFADLADATLEEHMTGVFIRKITSLGKKETETFRAKLGDSKGEIIIASAFDIPEQKRGEITDAVSAITGDSARSKFMVSDDLICGIELRSEGYTIGWNLDEYLDSLEEALSGLLEAKQS